MTDNKTHVAVVKTIPMAIGSIASRLLALVAPCLALSLIPLVGGSQTVIPQPIPCVTITQTNLPMLGSGIAGVDCIETDGDVEFDATSHYSIKGGEYIHFGQNTTIAPDATHQFHAYIQNSLDVAWYYPNATPGTVGQFEKLELGVQFNAEITQQIHNFTDDPQVAPMLNPFNPEQVDLYAEFWYLLDGAWYGPQRINGFYYEEFERGTTSWTKQLNGHDFRIRFAPKVIGTWRCKITANVAGYGTIVAPEFTFNCVDSESKPFVTVGANGRYFRMGDEPFFPVGQNLPWPLPSAGEGWEMGYHPIIPPDYYLGYHEQMESIVDNGGNYIRFINNPWSTDCEFEKLNDYSDRQRHGWELDRILEKADSLGLRIHFNLQIHYTFERPYAGGAGWWDWPKAGDSLNILCANAADSGYCYRSYLGIKDPVDFFSDTVAIKFYQYKLRYLIARYGYSNEIAVMELFSEVNNSGLTSNLEPSGGGWKDLDGANFRPYGTSAVFRNTIYLWQHEMCRYIKEDLQHTNHPLAVNYTGEPNTISDLSYYSPHVDILTYNNYGNAIAKSQLTYEKVIDYNTFGKPFMFSEYGANDGTEACDQNVDYIKTLVLTPFTGAAGSAMNWNGQLPGQEDRWHYMGPIKERMQGIPLDEENWQVGAPLVTGDKEVEVFYLIGPEWPDGQHKLVGAISNRSYNHFTQGDTLPCIDTTNEIATNQSYQQAESFAYSSLSSPLKVANMGVLKSYTIDWYDALTGNYWQTTMETSGVSEDLDLDFPGVITGTNASPILFFEVYPEGTVFKSAMQDTTVSTNSGQFLIPDMSINPIAETDWPDEGQESTLDQIETSDFYSVTPNPTKDNIWITIRAANFKDCKWTLVDGVGNSLISQNVLDANFYIDLSVYSKGIYFLIIETKDNKYVTKVVKL